MTTSMCSLFALNFGNSLHVDEYLCDDESSCTYSDQEADGVQSGQQQTSEEWREGGHCVAKVIEGTL